RGLPATDRGLPALQAADARAARPALVGTRATGRAALGRARGARPARGRGAAAGTRVRGAQRADVGLEAGEAGARAPARGGRGRDRGAAGLPAPLRAAGAGDPEAVPRVADAVERRVPPRARATAARRRARP